MKKYFLVLVFLLICKMSYAVDFTANYDYYQQPNKGNNYDNGRGYALGLRHSILYPFDGHLEVIHMTDIDFPSISDVKGSFGELRGYGGIYSLILDLVYNKNVSFNINAGLGPVWWDFRENPYMQDSQIKVKVEPSLVMRAGVETNIKIYDNWFVDLGAGWMDTTIGKKVTTPRGDVLNLLDAGDQINLRYITWKLAIRKKF